MALLVLLLAGPGTVRADKFINAVVAAVDGEAITLRDLDAYEKGRGRLLPPEESGGPRQMLRAMILGRLYRAEFDRYGMKADDDDVEGYIDRVLAERQGGRAEVMSALENAGLGWRDYFERMREEVQKLTLANREIRARISITDEQVERAWLAESGFELPERVEIGHIYMPLPLGTDVEQRKTAAEEAGRAYKAARSQGFEEAAKLYSSGAAAAEGGELGVFEPQSLAPFIVGAIEGLDEGDFSRPFEAARAWHIVRLTRRPEASRVPLEEVSDSLRKRLYDAELDRRFQNWVDHDLYERHHVADRYDEVERLAGK